MYERSSRCERERHRPTRRIETLACLAPSLTGSLCWPHRSGSHHPAWRVMRPPRAPVSLPGSDQAREAGGRYDPSAPSSFSPPPAPAPAAPQHAGIATITRPAASSACPGDPARLRQLPPLPPLPPPPESEDRPSQRPPTPPRPLTNLGLQPPPPALESLHEVPELTTLIGCLREIDRLAYHAIRQLRRVDGSRDIVERTGIGATTWLRTLTSRTSSDLRMLRSAGQVLDRLPETETSFALGQLSFSQVRVITLIAQRLPRHLDAAIDAAVVRVIAQGPNPDPDAVTRAIRRELDALDPTEVEEAEQAADQEGFCSLQPHADGSGGRAYILAGAADWAVLCDALADPTPGEASHAGFAGDRREDPDRDRRTELTRGAVQLRRLIGLLERSGTGPDGAPRAPQLLLRAELDALLDRAQTPAQLLTTLLGGHVNLSADAARRLVDERGAELTTIITDHGHVVGVGRRNRRPPGWLRDAVLALHDTCSAPGCTVASRACELDHAVPWHPADPTAAPSGPGTGPTTSGSSPPPGGTTDVDNLAPLCRRHNAHKEPDGWTAVQGADGVRVWHHRPTATTITTFPSRVAARRPDPDTHPSTDQDHGPDHGPGADPRPPP